jgi:hypothetical protein
MTTINTSAADMTAFQTPWSQLPARHRTTPLDRHAVLPVLQPKVDFVPEDKGGRRRSPTERCSACCADRSPNPA